MVQVGDTDSERKGIFYLKQEKEKYRRIDTARHADKHVVIRSDELFVSYDPGYAG